MCCSKIVIVFILLSGYTNAQNLNISSGWQILYEGYKNPVNITLNGYNRKNLIIQVEGGSFITEKGKSYIIPDGEHRIITIKAGIKTKSGKINWLDSGTCRVRNIEEQETLLGVRPNGFISKQELLTVSSINTGLGYDEEDPPIRYRINSYDILIIGETFMYSEHVLGSRLPETAFNIFKNSIGGEYIYVYNVRATITYRDVNYKTEVNTLPLNIRIKYVDTIWNMAYPDYNIKGFFENGFTWSTLKTSRYDFNQDSLEKKNGTWKLGEVSCGKSNILVEQKYKNDTLLGSTGYYSTGDIKYIAIPATSTSDGKFTSYYKNGGIRFTCAIKPSDDYYHFLLMF